jgi:hypothetical protein
MLNRVYSAPPERISSSVDDTFAAFIPSRLAQIIPSRETTGSRDYSGI